MKLMSLDVGVLSHSVSWYDFVFFFFQAEDGIRDVAVTGVQTCALPISREPLGRWAVRGQGHLSDRLGPERPIDRGVLEDHVVELWEILHRRHEVRAELVADRKSVV